MSEDRKFSSPELVPLSFPFVRHDAPWTFYEITRTALCAVFLLPIRLLVVVSLCVCYYLIARVAMLGVGDTSGPLHPFRVKILDSISIIGRIVLFTLGFINIEVKGSSKLPPGVKIIVSNHQSWIDVLIYSVITDASPSFVAKRSVQDIPLFGRIAKAKQCIYVDRLAPQREGASAIVRTRAVSQDMPPVVVFPEGTTTNGRSLIRFHSGAFSACLAVRPCVVRYPYMHFSPCWESVSAVWHIFRLLTQLVNHACVEWLDVYEPSKEEKSDPVLYANNVRQVMADSLGVPVVEHSFREKVLFLKFQRENREKLL